jgi:hypothetical protein
VTVPPGSGHPLDGYAGASHTGATDAGYTDTGYTDTGYTDSGWAGTAGPPPGEPLRELPRGRHSGARPAAPTDPEAG